MGGETRNVVVHMSKRRPHRSWDGAEFASGEDRRWEGVYRECLVCGQDPIRRETSVRWTSSGEVGEPSSSSFFNLPTLLSVEEKFALLRAELPLEVVIAHQAEPGSAAMGATLHG